MVRKLPTHMVEGGVGARSLGELDDVDLSTPATPGQVLKPGLDGIWRPGSDNTGGAGGTGGGAAPFVTAMRSGLWYESPISPSLGTATLTQGVLHYVPFYVPHSITVSEASIEATSTGAGSTVAAGIYDDNQGYPGNRVGLFGTFDTAATGVKTITGLSVALSAGLYWLAACVVTGTPTLRQYSTGGSPGAFLGTATPGATSISHLGWALTGVTSLAATAPGTPSTANPNGNRIRVQVKVA